MLDIGRIIVDYLKGQPFQNVLTAILLLMLGGMGYFQWDDAVARRKQTKEAHELVHTILQERDAKEKEVQDRIDNQNERLISVLMGVKQEQKKTTAAVQEATVQIPVATAKATAKVTEEKANQDSSPPGL